MLSDSFPELGAIADRNGYRCQGSCYQREKEAQLVSIKICKKRKPLDFTENVQGVSCYNLPFAQAFEDRRDVRYSGRAFVMRRWWNGIHIRLRGVRLTAWEFESPPAPQENVGATQVAPTLRQFRCGNNVFRLA